MLSRCRLGAEIRVHRCLTRAAGRSRSRRGSVLSIAQPPDPRFAAFAASVVTLARTLKISVRVLSSEARPVVPGEPDRGSSWNADHLVPTRLHPTVPGEFTRISALAVKETRTKVILNLTDAMHSPGCRSGVLAQHPPAELTARSPPCPSALSAQLERMRVHSQARTSPPRSPQVPAGRSVRSRPQTQGR